MMTQARASVEVFGRQFYRGWLLREDGAYEKWFEKVGGTYVVWPCGTKEFISDRWYD